MAVASLTITTLSVTFSPSNAMQCISSSNAAPEGSEILQPISEREAKSQIEPLSVPYAVTLAFLITSFSVVPLYQSIPYSELFTFTLQSSMVKLLLLA